MNQLIQKSLHIATLLALSIFWFCGGKTENEKNTTTTNASLATATTARPPSKWALLVGINIYRNSGARPDFSNLAGCVNDVEDMKSLLLGTYDFPPDHIQVLTDARATHTAIIDAFKNHLIANAQANDVVIFYFSGHGSQMKDTSGDEADGYDETIVPHDTRDREGKVFDISDDELNELLRQLSQKTKKVTFIFDSCHSGSAVRGAGQAKKIPADDRTPPPAPAYAPRTRGIEGASDLRLDGLEYVLISGCRSNESSFEHLAANNIERGALSYFLTQKLRSAGSTATYRDVMDNVMGEVNAKYPSQHPELEGARADYYVFGDSSRLPQPYLLASPRGTKNVVLNGGLIYGLTAGSRFDIYPPGAKKFAPPETPIATIELTTVNPDSAVGIFKSGRTIPNFSRAVERQRQYGALKLRVYYKNLAASPKLTALKTELGQSPFIETTAQESGYHLLVRQTGNEIVIEGGDATGILSRVPLDDPELKQKVAKQIRQWAQWFNVLSIINPTPTLGVKLTVTAKRGGQTRSPFASIGQAEAVLKIGEQIECTIENTSPESLYVALVDLSTDGSVSVIHPYPPGASELLPAGAKLSKTFEATLAAGQNSIKDILKVFATTRPVDFRFLTQPPVRGAETRDLPDDPFQQLLANAFLGTRALTPVVPLTNWVTAQRVVEVRR